MKQIPFILLLLIILTINLCPAKAQNNQHYIDSIRHYTAFIDSLIRSYYFNLEQPLLHTVAHYALVCGNSRGAGTKDLYSDSANKFIYQLRVEMNCDSNLSSKTYYFINNKIVSAAIATLQQGQSRDVVNYYRSDLLVFPDNNNLVKNKRKENSDLRDGYEELDQLKQLMDYPEKSSRKNRKTRSH